VFERAPQPFRLGNYEPLMELASGGMARVYAARQIGAGGFERMVVIKRVHQHLLTSREFRDMFRDEARVASVIHHPNVVPVIDVVEWEGELLLVMEYVDSTSLSTLLKVVNRAGQRIPPAIAVRIVADTLSGLHAAHEVVDMRGVRLELVHRDVSPQNILVAVDGSTRLIDFGVAKARHRITQTRSGSLKGKYAYMAPEQLKGLSVERRADIFSTGAVLLEVLTGKAIFRGETEFDTMRMIVEEPIPNPSTMVPGVPPELDAVVQRSLDRDPNRRFQSAAEMLEHLEAAMRPASSREVAAFADEHCGKRLRWRRDALRAVIDGRMQPLLPEHDGEARTVLEGALGNLTPLSMPSRATASQIASSTDASLAPRESRRTVLIAGIVSAVTVSCILLAFWALVLRPAAPASTTALASTSSPATTKVTLTALAPSEIDRVSAPETPESRIEGNRVTIVMPPFEGKLVIAVMLKDGRVAHGEAEGGGAREVFLEAEPMPSAAPPVASSAPDAPKVTGPRVRGGGRPSELHENPYGTP
jgi:serine/threonine-protein kinase